MNRVYKTIFNKTTQTWVAVCEWAKSAGKGSKNQSGSAKTHQKSSIIGQLSLAVLYVLLGNQAVLANTQTTIIADPSAPKNLQPTILPTASGLTQVNIQSPNQQGISNNHYSQFDVGQEGVILNNSRKAVNTHLAGFVDGNPNMARGEARIILNQINSSHPSKLHGPAEVAGGRAEVIIANPAGIQVDGGGFINAKAVQLTTATPIFNQEGLLSTPSQTATANISIDGKGLNNTHVDYTTIIADTAHVNAQIHSKDKLSVHTKTTLDVSHLGGMYANAIHLVGTAQGVGVNNAGIIATGASGTLHLDNTGKLTNQKTGVISGGQLQLNAQNLHNQGQIEQLGTGNLVINAQDFTSKKQAVLGTSLYDTTPAQTGTNAPTQPSVGGTQTGQTPPTTQVGTQQTIAKPNHAEGHISVWALTNEGTINSAGKLSLNTQHLTHTEQSSLHVHDLTVKQGVFTNTDARIHAKSLQADVEQFYQQGGSINADILTLSTKNDISHSKDETLYAKELSLTSTGKITNTGNLTAQDSLSVYGQHLLNTGTINSDKTYIEARDTLDNRAEGKIYGTTIAIKADTLNNTPDKQAGNAHHSAPIIVAREQLNIGVKHLNNNPNPDRAGKFNKDFEGQAQILSLGAMSIGGDLTGTKVIGKAKTLTNRGATIQSGAQMNIGVEKLSNENAHFEKERVQIDKKPHQTFYRPQNTTEVHHESTVYLGPTRKGLSDAVLHTKDADGNWVNRGEEWDRIYKTLITLEDRTQFSDPARLVAGQDLILLGDNLVSDKSQVSAGEGYFVKGDVLNQDADVDLTGHLILAEEDKRYQSHTVGWNGWGSKHKHEWGGMVYEAPTQTIQKTYILPILDANIASVQVGADVDKVVRTNDKDVEAPKSALYVLIQDPNAKFVYQTDPAFTNHKNWLSSDYMLSKVSSNPNDTHKRLNDGFGEQERIRDDYFVLTGKNILSDYTDMDMAYKTLMDNAIKQKDVLNLRVGVALTAEQLSKLTNSLVWLVSQNVLLPDGQTATVLVPKLYVTAKQADLMGNQSGSYAKDVQMAVGTLHNQGNIHATQHLDIQADDIINQQGGQIRANTVNINTSHNLDNTGGTLQATTAMNIKAGGTLKAHSDTKTHSDKLGASSSQSTNITHQSRIMVTGDGKNLDATTLSIQADNMDTKASVITNQSGHTHLHAQNDIHLGALKETQDIVSIGDEHNHHKHRQSKDIGTTIHTQGNLIVSTKAGSIFTNALSATSNNNISLIAPKDVMIKAGQHDDQLSVATRHTNKGLVSKKTQSQTYDHQQQNALKSTLEASKLTIMAGNNVDLTAVDVATNGIYLSGNNITLGAFKNTNQVATSAHTKKSGLIAGDGASFTLGKQSANATSQLAQTSHTGSVLEATGGNIVINAKGNYTQEASHLHAHQGDLETPSQEAGNIAIGAKNIDIKNTLATFKQATKHQQRTSGLTVSVNSTVLDTASSIETLAKDARHATKDRTRAMAALSAASKAHSLANNLQNPISGRASATIGSQSSQSTSQSYHEQNEASTISASGNLYLTAQGDDNTTKADGNITITGSALTAGGDLYQKAGSVTAQAATLTNTTSSKNRSQGAGFGVFADTSSGYGITAHANGSKAGSSSHATTHINSQIVVGGTTHNDIAGDFSLDGANLTTKHLTGSIGGDLIVKSRQDTYNYDSKQQNLGASIDITKKSVGGSLNGGKQELTAKYKAVNEQSGISANSSNLTVQGQGVFTGGYLLTEQDKNHTTFGKGIHAENLTNELYYEGNAISAGINVSHTTKNQQKDINQQNNQPQDTHKNLPKIGLGSLGHGNIAPTHNTSTTYSAVTDQAGKKEATLQDKDRLNEHLANDFNAEKLNAELGREVRVTSEFGKEAPKAVADFSQSRITDIINNPNLSQEQKKEQILKWQEGGVYRVALHTAMGMLATGTAEGAVSAGTTAYTIPKIDEYLQEQGFDEEIREATLLALSAGIGASIGDSTASTTNNVGQTQWNYLSHRENERLRELEKEKSRLSNAYGNCVSKRCAEITQEIRKLKKLSKQRDKAFDRAYANCRAGKDCNQFYYLHVTQRSEWNKEGVELFKKQFNPKLSYDQQSEDFKKTWKQYDEHKNAFHNFSIDGKTILKNPDGTYPHAKYVHKKGGQFEVIVDKKTGKIVTTPSNAGTFNYYKDMIGHTDYDVDPWADFGSGNGDNTKYNLRRSGSGILFGEFGIWDDKDKAIEKFKKIDEEKKK